jgi:altronate dehydratase
MECLDLGSVPRHPVEDADRTLTGRIQEAQPKPMSRTDVIAECPDRVPALEVIGRLPLPGDNAAIAVDNLAAGTSFRIGDCVHVLSHDILEGHRFAVSLVEAGRELLSWNLPFGRALRPIRPGEYLCNAGMLDALRLRDLGFELPRIPNFQNAVAKYELDEATYRPGRQVGLHEGPGRFMGYRRAGGRGVGTRNVIVVLGTSSATAAFAQQLARRLKEDVAGMANIDGIEAVTHTEGGAREKPNNLDLVLRTLAGFMVHPNVAAILAVDTAGEGLDNARLRQYLAGHRYPLDAVPHAFYTLEHDIEQSLEDCSRIVRGWYPLSAGVARQASPLSELKIALQCGGSDAFSGVSGNPLAGRVAREVIRHGGAASLAETDELMGAEPYMLANTRSLDVARRFLQKLAVFRERLAWHGQSAEGNPSGGNLFRGLYNISLKSIGAARKKDPDVRLDHVIDYAERMQQAGFYFMDSPGNDLESIAGQVASGCNLIFFITGNGSITNFPFVPTIKFVTTTRRWELLSNDMDVNAGRYQDGESLEDLGMETFGYAVRVASGGRSVGERAGHSQVSIWRDWCQTDGSQLEQLRRASMPDGVPAPVSAKARDRSFELPPNPEKVGLILPTSLCAGQIALQIAGELNTRLPRTRGGLSRFVALPHTEGCGASSGENEDHYLRTVVGHLLHPMVGAALLLEHGCERTHNDLMRHTLQQYGVNPGRFGFASIQLDGGIDAVMEKVIAWFAGLPETHERDSGPAGSDLDSAFSLGLTATGPVTADTARALAQLTIGFVAGGGSVIVPRSASLTGNRDFLARLGSHAELPDTLAYGQVARQRGFHVMATPTADFVESLTGLGGTGVQVILVHVSSAPRQGHPMIPTLQVATVGREAEAFAGDLDWLIDERRRNSEEICEELISRIRDTAACDYFPKAWSRGYTNFQLTRGLLGVSL